jgi:transposase
MDVLYPRCAGLDVHKSTIFACVLIGQGRSMVKHTFKSGTFPHQLLELKQKLLEFGVTHVLMESTGVYWMPIYDALEGSMEVVVANAQHVMNVPGRKTDETDAEWLTKLLRYGLVTPSFVPPRPLRELRTLTRYRRAIVEARSAEQNRIEKHLQIAGIKLTSVASRLDTVSGMDMLQHIAKGQTDAKELAALARGKLRPKIAALEQAFAGAISPHTQQMIALQVRQLNRLDCTVAEVELNIAQKAHAYADAITRLDAIPGIDRSAALAILAEIGVDMSPWKTHRQLAAMAGVCPANYISAGKRLKNRSRRGNPYLKANLVQVACSAINKSGSYYQTKYLRLKQRRGHKRAVLAIAHAILVTIYHMLKRDEPYHERGAQFITDDEKGRKQTSLVRQLEKLGYSVQLTSAPHGP